MVKHISNFNFIKLMDINNNSITVYSLTNQDKTQHLEYIPAQANTYKSLV